MKAIVLTYAPITKEEAKLLKETKIYKIACNDYCAELKPDIRLCADNIVDKCLNCDTCPVVSVNYDLEKQRVINGCTLPKRHSSLLHCIDYLYLEGYTDILLVASNPVNTATYENNYKTVDIMKNCVNLYKYSKDGNFNIPHVTIKEFMTMQKLTDEEKLLGITEPKAKTLFEKTIFTDAFQYEVQTKGFNNKSIENGTIIASICTTEQKQRLLAGETEIEANGLIIRMLTRLQKETVKEEPKQETVTVTNPSEMSYQEMVTFVKKHNLKPDSNKKADLIKAIKEFEK